MLGRNREPRRSVCPHVLLLISFSYPSSASCPTTKTILQVATQDDLRVPIALLPALAVSPLQLSLLLHLTSRALGQRLPTHKAATTLQWHPYDTPSFSTLSFVALPSLFNLHRRHPRGRPYHTKPRPSRIMYLAREDGFLNRIKFSSARFSFALPAQPFCFLLFLLLYDLSDAAPT